MLGEEGDETAARGREREPRTMEAKVSEWVVERADTCVCVFVVDLMDGGGGERREE